MRSLRRQLSAAIAAPLLIIVALVSVFSNILIGKQFEKYIIEQQSVKTANIVANLADTYSSLAGKWNPESIHLICVNALYDGYAIKIFDNNDNIIWDAQTHNTVLCSQIMAEIEQRMNKKRPEMDGKFISQNHDIVKNGRQIGTVAIEFYGPYFLSDIDFRLLDSLNFVLIFVGLTSLIFSLLLGARLSRVIAVPITKTAEIAGQISDGNYDISFEGKTKTKELNSLVSAINRLASELSEQKNLRSRLTADIAHELRTPLAILETHLEAMIEQVWEPTPERLTSCHEEILRLSKLVSDLEHIERAENDSLQLNKSPVDLLSLVRMVAGNFEAELINKNLQLSVNGEASMIMLDKDRIRGVISNLLSNAVKYTPEKGKINILVGDYADRTVLTIDDNGIGIPENELPHIFERFYRADKSRNRGTGGTGLGLAIIKSIITAHGGNVVAQSDFGRGSRFIVTLPK